VFLVILIVGVVAGEVFFPYEGIQGRGMSLQNDTMCTDNIAGGRLEGVWHFREYKYYGAVLFVVVVVVVVVVVIIGTENWKFHIIIVIHLVLARLFNPLGIGSMCGVICVCVCGGGGSESLLIRTEHICVCVACMYVFNFPLYVSMRVNTYVCMYV